MTTNKKQKRTHNNQQTIEPFYTIRYLFIFVTTLGRINALNNVYFINLYSYFLASVTVYHIHKELVRPKLEHLVVYEVSYWIKPT